jgi:hypothetical protein
MNGIVRQRARLARVRRIQHGLAASHAAAAADRVQMLEMNRDRLRRMRSELQPIEGTTSGAALARMGELGSRIDGARQGLAVTIESARSAAIAREAERVVARRDQESAERLEQAAVRAAEEIAERRFKQAGRRRASLADGETK